MNLKIGKIISATGKKTLQMVKHILLKSVALDFSLHMSSVVLGYGYITLFFLLQGILKNCRNGKSFKKNWKKN